MKRISGIAVAALLAASLTGCVIHPMGVDPLTGCRTGCSIEAVPGGPLDACCWLNALRCPVLPWNWGQFLHCGSCEPGAGHGCRTGCGFGGGHLGGPLVDGGFAGAYPPMLTGDCCEGGMPGFVAGGPSCGADGCSSCGVGPGPVPYGVGMPYPAGVGTPVYTGFGPDGVPTEQAPHPTETLVPVRPHSAPADPMHAPMHAPMPMPGALPGPMSMPMPTPAAAPSADGQPATLMSPTSYYVSPTSYVTPMGYTTPAGLRTRSPYVAQPAMLPQTQAYPMVRPF